MSLSPFCLIRRTDNEQVQQAANATIATHGVVSIADELTKLSTLMEKGLLTADEFFTEKRKLLERHRSEPVVETTLDERSLDIRRTKI